MAFSVLRKSISLDFQLSRGPYVAPYSVRYLEIFTNSNGLNYRGNMTKIGIHDTSCAAVKSDIVFSHDSPVDVVLPNRLLFTDK